MSLNVNRRDFLKVLGVTGAGASTALLSGCYPTSPGSEYLHSRLAQPPEQTPGEFLLYATTDPTGSGVGVRARCREGRVINLEGNPEHPGSNGSISARVAAQTQGLYNPDRLAKPLRRTDGGQLAEIEWPEAMETLRIWFRERLDAGRAGAIAWLTGEIADSDAAVIEAFAQALGTRPPVNLRLQPEGNLAAAARDLFGYSGVPEYRIDQATFLVSFGADFLETWGDPVAQIGAFTKMHAHREGVVGRAIYVGPRQSSTAASCDRWVKLAPGKEAAALRVLIEGIGAGEAAHALSTVPLAAAQQVLGDELSRTLLALGQEVAAAEAPLVIANGSGPDGAQARALALLATHLAGGTGRTIIFPQVPRPPRGARHGEVKSLLDDVQSGAVEMLLVHSANPAFLMPGGRAALEAAGTVVHFGTQHDETAHLADLVLPIHHFLETWGYHQCSASVLGLIQPAMRPVPRQLPDDQPYPQHLAGPGTAKLDAGLMRFDSRPFPDTVFLLDAILDTGVFGPSAELPHGLKSAEDHFVARVMAFGAEHPEVMEGLAPAAFLREAKRRGVLIAPVPSLPVTLRGDASLPAQNPVESGSITALFFPHPFLVDGRDADKPWLQEIPETSTAAVWDTWAEIHPATAEGLGVGLGDSITLTRDGAEITVPVLPLEQVMQGVIAVPIGNGHEHMGRYATGVGANPMPLAHVAQSGDNLVLHGFAVETRAQAGTGELVRTTFMQTQLGRPLAQATDLAHADERTDYPGVHFDTGQPGSNLRSMYERHEATVHEQFMWGMTVDLDACVGCGACVAACYAENNVPFVGKELIRKGREMSWLRIEKYVEDTGEVRHLPNLCQHCHNAPCEPVCPVHAAYHTYEGLNGQVYNRCVGTRYCSNNCTYKVRRFNWFDYHHVPEPLNLLFNPDVTVRERGVMEKCTFCTQRIRKGREDARRAVLDQGDEAYQAARPEDGAITPACAQACPAKVFHFGNMADPTHEVNAIRQSPRSYHLLGDLGTRPSVTYLKKVVREGEIAVHTHAAPHDESVVEPATEGSTHAHE